MSDNHTVTVTEDEYEIQSRNKNNPVYKDSLRPQARITA